MVAAVLNLPDAGPGNAYTMQIPIDRLMVHPDRQRELHAHKVRKMFREFGGFNEELAGFIDVTENEDRNGYYWIMAGQHRVKVAEMDGVTEVWCLVHPYLSPAKQAQFYVGSTLTTKPTPLELWRIRRESGEEFVLEVEGVLAYYDIKVAKTRGTGLRTLVAVSTLEKLAKKGGLARLANILHISTRAYPDKPVLTDWFLAGMEYFLWAYEEYPKFDFDLLIKTLQRIDPVLLQRRGLYHASESGGRSGGGPQTMGWYYAKAILEEYNRRKGHNRLPVERLDASRFLHAHKAALPASLAVPEVEA